MSEKQEQNQPEKPKSIVVKVDNENSAKMLKQLSEEKEELQKQLNEMKTKAFEQKKRELNAPEEITTQEQLDGFRLAKEAERAKQHGGASGSTPLPRDYNKRERQPEAFQDFETMVKTLRNREAQGDPVAKAQLNALFAKTKNVLGTFDGSTSPVEIAKQPKKR